MFFVIIYWKILNYLNGFNNKQHSFKFPIYSNKKHWLIINIATWIFRHSETVIKRTQSIHIFVNQTKLDTLMTILNN